jgi:hypothetical protein
VRNQQQSWALALLVAGALAACSDAAPPSCVMVDTTCAPLYAPTFDNVYSMTLKNTCGSSDVSCHSAQGRKGNLSFQDEPTAYAELMAGRVKAGDPGCSLMIVRTDSVGASYQMPPGDPMSEPERCALIQWVQAGAPGPSATPAASSGGASDDRVDP